MVQPRVSEILLALHDCVLLIFQFRIAFDDYLPVSTNLTFQPFQTFSSVSLSIINNEFVEAVEQFSITLISYEEDIRIRGDLLITIIDNRGTYSTKVAPYLGPIHLLGIHEFKQL